MSKTLTAKIRGTETKNQRKQNRKEGIIPGVMYGAGVEKNIEVTVDETELMKAYKSGSKLFDLECEGKTRKVFIKELQRNPITWNPVHVDFIAVQEGSDITIKVPVRYEGVPFGVKNQGGVLIINSRNVEISCKPEFLPEELVVDVTAVKIKGTIHAADLEFDNIKIVSPAEQLLCRVTPTRASVSDGISEVDDEDDDAAEASTTEAAAE